MFSRKLSILIPISLALVLCAVFFLDKGEQVVDVKHMLAETANTPLPEASTSPEPETSQLPYTSKYGALVSSLKGIYFDRHLAVDEAGNLRISSDIKDVFDFFFSAIEDEELDVVLNRIREYLSYKLDEPARGQAFELLNDYVKYKASILDLELAFSERIQQFSNANEAPEFGKEYLDLVSERMEAVKLLRSEVLNPEMHEAFYGEKELYDNYMLSKLAIQADSTLTEQQKRSALEILDNNMPAEFISKRAAANPVEALRMATAASSDTEDIYTVRADLVGEDAAQRLGDLDGQRALWTQRYDSYAIQRDAIIANEAFSTEVKQNELSALRAGLFDENERIRVTALDQIKP